MKNNRECLDFLNEVVKRDEKFKLLALEDSDLSDIREKLINLGWGEVKV